MITYQPTDPNNPLQDIAYEYDLAGNILAIHDHTPGSGTQPFPDQLDRTFTYDTLYRLLSATGRECDSLPSAPSAPPWNDSPCCEDVNRTRGYRETYEYDPVGNIESLTHNGGSTGYTRNFSIFQGSNRLNNMNINGSTYSYTYDDNGNLTQENTMHHFEWDHSDRMRAYSTQVDSSEPSVHVHYLYDSQGNRVKKLVRKQGGQVEVTVYVDGVFEHHRLVQGNKTQENNTLHVMDNQSRIALIRIGDPFPDDRTPAVKYHLGDHLGSINVIIDVNGALVNREEYTPYGETSFGSFARKRYRFTGKERDEESGLYYFGARYYAPWMGRWESCDPLGITDGINLYTFVRDNPVKLIDVDGKQSVVDQSYSGKPTPGGGSTIVAGAPSQPTTPITPALSESSGAPSGGAVPSGSPGSPQEEPVQEVVVHGVRPPRPVECRPIGRSPVEAPQQELREGYPTDPYYVRVDIEGKTFFPSRELLEFAQWERGKVMARERSYELGAVAVAVGPGVARVQAGTGPDISPMAIPSITNLSSLSSPRVPPASVRGPHTLSRPPPPTSPPLPGQIVLGGRPAPTVAMPIGGGHASEIQASFRMPEGTYLRFPVPSGSKLGPHDALTIENTGRIPLKGVDTRDLGLIIQYGPGDIVPEHILYPPGWGIPTSPPGEYATTVTQPTLLSNIIEPNMGLCVFTGCRTPGSY